MKRPGNKTPLNAHRQELFPSFSTERLSFLLPSFFQGITTGLAETEASSSKETLRPRVKLLLIVGIGIRLTLALNVALCITTA